MKGRHVSVCKFVYVVRVTCAVTQIRIHTRGCRHGRWEIILEVRDKAVTFIGRIDLWGLLKKTCGIVDDAYDIALSCHKVLRSTDEREFYFEIHIQEKKEPCTDFDSTSWQIDARRSTVLEAK